MAMNVLLTRGLRNMQECATLRGFHVSVADVGDQMHLCHPLLSFEGDPALYLAHRLDWRDDPKALTIADPDEARVLGTLLPPTCGQPIASGEGLVAMGPEPVRAAETAQVELLDSEIPFVEVDGSECWIGVATSALYMALRTRLAEDARAAFDEALEDAAHRGRRLSERGDAALFLMRKCGSLRRDALAIRQLVGALQNREIDLYRRLLIRFAFELDTQEDVLDERVKRHVATVTWKADMSRTERTELVYDDVLPSIESLKVRHDLEDTLRIGASVIESVADVMRNLDVLSVDAKRRCIGQEFEENLKRAAKSMQEIEGMFNSVRDP